MVLAQLDIHMQKNDIVSLSDTIYVTKVNAKCIIDLNVIAKNIKLLEENIHKHRCLGWTPKAKVIKEIIDKLNLTKIYKFCAAKDTIMKVKTTSGIRINICKSYLIRDLYPEYINN